MKAVPIIDMLAARELVFKIKTYKTVRAVM
jgi:hypothetical protein